MSRAKPLRSSDDIFDAQSHFNETERKLSALERAWAKASLALRTGMRFGHGPRQIRTMSLEAVHDRLDVYRARIAGGEMLDTLHAIGLCAEENLPLPEWLARGFADAMMRFYALDGPNSLDAVFCTLRKRVKGEKADHAIGRELYFALWTIARDHHSFDSALDAVLATRNWGVRKTKARRLVLDVEAPHVSLMSGMAPTFSQFFAKRRKRQSPVD